MSDIEARRAHVVATALEWIGTPYVNCARVKGRNGGIDCLTLVAGVFEEAGEIPRFEIPRYAPDWHMHHNEELYLDGKEGVPGLRHWADEMPGPDEREPLPGDIMMFQFGKCFAHGSIVVKWPIIIHAYARRPVGRDDANRTSVLSRIHESIPQRGQPRPRKVFTLKSWV